MPSNNWGWGQLVWNLEIGVKTEKKAHRKIKNYSTHHPKKLIRKLSQAGNAGWCGMWDIKKPRASLQRQT